MWIASEEFNLNQHEYNEKVNVRIATVKKHLNQHVPWNHLLQVPNANYIK